MIQFVYFLEDVYRSVGRKKYRLIGILFTRLFWGIFSYRTDRALFLLFGKFYNLIRLPLVPVFFLLQTISNVDIHYRANILGGLVILHPSAGVVISGRSQIGKNLTLVGGNIIGIRKPINYYDLKIGDNVFVGANAVILGPIVIGNEIKVGSLANVVHNCLSDGAILIGNPAKPYCSNSN